MAIWGLHMGLTQGLLSAMVAGLMWERIGSPATFATGAALSLVTLLAVAMLPSQAADAKR